MRKIYLASRSRPRKKLLKMLGIKFTVFPSFALEEREPKSSYQALVKTNALKKARDVAGKIKTGVVIAADTIMVQDRKIFGKPKDLKDAKKMLKSLSRDVQDVYTGLAVIDKDNNKTRTACERTKVYMDKLSDKEIDSYFAATSPLDKAGSFDIQGKGGLFIRRIDGCFYNVVGLPLRSLYRMLKEMDIKVLLVLVFILPALSGCSPEYNVVTKEQESYFYSTDSEVQMGKSMDKAIKKQFKPAQDPLVQDRVERIGKKIADVCDRKDITYHFAVIEDKEVNAFSIPGGYVYVNTGLMDKISNDDELAGVLGHEVGHIVARHSIKRLQGQMGYAALRLLAAQAPGSSAVGETADVAFTMLLLGYSREDEFLADSLGAKYLKLAGYNPASMISFLEKLGDVNRRSPAREINYFKTHPYVPDRIRAVKEVLGQKMDFKDFINIEEEPRK